MSGKKNGNGADAGGEPNRLATVRDPEVLDDLFMAVDNVSKAKAVLDSLGLLKPAMEKALDQEQSDISAEIAGKLRFQQGTLPIVVKHTDDSGVEHLFAYEEQDGQPLFGAVEVVDSKLILLNPPPPPTDAGGTGGGTGTGGGDATGGTDTCGLPTP